MRGLLIVVLAACAGKSGDTLDSIPKAAAAALRAQAGGATIEKVERERDLYEGTWTVDGLEREATVTAGGELVEYEEEVASTQVPQMVRAAAMVKIPGAQAMTFSRVRDGNYEVEAIVDGREVEVTLSPKGEVVVPATSEANVDRGRSDP